MSKGSLEFDPNDPKNIVLGGKFLTIIFMGCIALAVGLGFFFDKPGLFHVTWGISLLGFGLFGYAGYLDKDKTMWSLTYYWFAMLVFSLWILYGPGADWFNQITLK